MKTARPRPRWGWRRLAAGSAAGIVVGLLVWWIVARLVIAPDPTWERIQEAGILRVCMDPSWPPFEFFVSATGQIEGLDAELAYRLAEELVPGGRAALVTVGFDSLYDALIAERCDAIVSALPYDPAMAEDVAYSVAYFDAGLVLVVAEACHDIKTLEDLPGRVVGVEWGFIPEGDPRQQLLLRDLPVRRYDTAWDLLSAVHAGEVDAGLVDRVSALTYQRQCQGVRLVGEPVTDVSYVIPVRPDSVRLLGEINRLLLEMRRDGTLEELQRRWF